MKLTTLIPMSFIYSLPTVRLGKDQGSVMNQTKALKNQPFDAEKWQKLYYRNQQQYIRHRREKQFNCCTKAIAALKFVSKLDAATIHSQVGFANIFKVDSKH